MDRQRRLVIVALVAVHVLLFVHALTQQQVDTTWWPRSDAFRFHEILTLPGRPYHDFDAEYPPGALLFFQLLGPGSASAWLVRLMVTQLLSDFGIAAVLAWRWGTDASIRWLILCAPFLEFLIAKYDLLSAFLAVGAIALVDAGWRRTGGVVLGASPVMKIWTAALVPLLAVRREWRAFRSALVAAVAGGVVWLAMAGVDGTRQVLTFRDATGWHDESGAGNLLQLVTGADRFFDNAVWRVGDPPGALRLLLLVVLAAALVEITRAAWDAGAPVGLTETALVAALLIFSPLYSPQFVIWMVPFLAIAGARGEQTVERLGAAVLVLTFFVIAVADSVVDHKTPIVLVRLLRNLATLGLAGVAYARLRQIAAAARRAVPATAG